MCFTCSSFSCCSSFKKSASSKMNVSKLEGGDRSVWQRSRDKPRVVLEQLRTKKRHPRPLPDTPAELARSDVEKKIEKLLDKNLFEDVKNANVEPERRAPSGTPQDLLEQWVIGLRMDIKGGDPDQDSTSFSDMSTQTESWAEELADERRVNEDGAKGRHWQMDDEYKVTNGLNRDEASILESRLKWMGRVGADRLNQRRSVTLPNWTRTNVTAGQRSSLTARSDNSAALADFRRQLAEISSKESRLEPVGESRKATRLPEGFSKRSSGTCSCSNSSCGCSCCSDAWWRNEKEKGEGEKGEAIFKGRAADDPTEPPPDPCKMEDESTSSASSGYEEWRNGGVAKDKAKTQTSTTTTTTTSNNWSPPESDEWVFVVSTSLSSSNVLDEGRNVGTEKKGDSLGYGTLPPSDSDLILAAKTAAKSRTVPLEKRPIVYLRKKLNTGKEDAKKSVPNSNNNLNKSVEGQNGAAPHGKVLAEVARINAAASAERLSRLMPSDVLRQRSSSLGRSFGKRLPDFDESKLTSPVKRSARKQRLLRERAMQIEVERAQMTTDDEDESQPIEDVVRPRRRARSRTFSGERRQALPLLTPQIPGIGRLLMVQATYGQQSLARDNVHITAV